jgi:flavin-dependent dehydrogenase
MSIGVVGGGLAGLAAAIGLAQRGRAVVVWESGDAGRDKVCGEFLSPEAEDDLASLGVLESLDATNPAVLRSVAIFGPSGARVDLTLKGRAARGITRRALEGALLSAAREAGAIVHERCPVRGVEGARDRLVVRTDKHEAAVTGLVLAFGKRSSLDAPLGLPRAHAGDGFVAIKAYFQARSLEADVELYVVDGGYVGVNPVEGGRIGVCALLSAKRARASFEELVELARTNPTLARRLASLGPRMEKPRGLARFGFGAQAVARVEPASRLPLLFAGDAARLVPSFTGDGMAIALRSGRLAADALLAEDPASAYARAFSSAFRVRFAVASALHGLFFRPCLFEAVAPLVARSPRLLDRIYEATRR